MIIEHRTYTIQPGKVGEYWSNYGADGFALHEGHLGKCVGQYHSEAGRLNQLVMMWQFDGFDQRMERKATMDADPKWQELLHGGLAPLVNSIETKLLVPSPFWTPP